MCDISVNHVLTTWNLLWQSPKTLQSQMQSAVETCRCNHNSRIPNTHDVIEEETQTLNWWDQFLNIFSSALCEKGPRFWPERLTGIIREAYAGLPERLAHGRMHAKIIQLFCRLPHCLLLLK